MPCPAVAPLWNDRLIAGAGKCSRTLLALKHKTDDVTVYDGDLLVLTPASFARSFQKWSGRTSKHSAEKEAFFYRYSEA